MNTKYIGLTKEDASKLASESGLKVRIINNDGRPQILTDDRQIGRINLEITDGVVTSVWIG